MSAITPEDHGRFVWYDLMTTDQEAAKQFYTNVCHWTTALWEESGEPYTMWRAADTEIGGLMDLPEEVRAMGAPPHWTAYVAVTDVDASAQQAAELGGNILHPPTDIPNVGRFAVIQDPQGAVISVFAPSNPLGDDTPPSTGHFSWHELATSDMEAATEFYRAMFGWSAINDHDMGPIGIYRIYGRGERPLGGMFTKPAEMPGPPMWLYYISVDDLESTLVAVKALGGAVLYGPHEVPGGDLIAQCTDPQGAMFSLHWSAQTSD